MKPSDNVLKLTGYGVYVTCVDGNLFTCTILAGTSGPSLDPDGCLEWEKLEDPANQKFLNCANAYFNTCFTMNDYGKVMSISEIKEHVAHQETMETESKPDNEVIIPSNLTWLVKNMREKNK